MADKEAIRAWTDKSLCLWRDEPYMSLQELNRAILLPGGTVWPPGEQQKPPPPRIRNRRTPAQ